MCFSSPKVPPAQAPPPTVTPQDPAITAALDADRRRKASAAGGYKSTVLTGGAGLASAPSTATKTLLGQ